MAPKIAGQRRTFIGDLFPHNGITVKILLNPKRKMAPPNLHEPLTHDVRLRLAQSHG
jgi:hypothetical protein